jgi:alpha-L-fucosidase
MEICYSLFRCREAVSLHAEESQILAAITSWMHVSSAGIYGTRPWKVHGEGPGLAALETDLAFNEQNRKDLTADKIRFTSKGRNLYAFAMSWPSSEIVVKSLGTKSELNPEKVHSVELLGHKGKLKWSQEEAGLRVRMPVEKPSDYAVTLKITMG